MLNAVGRLITRSFFSRPVFVVGVGRSGTSVLKRALGEHSSVLACDGESPSISHFAASIGPIEHGERNAYYREALRIEVDDVYESVRRLCFEAALGPAYGLRKIVAESARKRRSPLRIRYWCAKTFPTKEQAMSLLGLYPDARYAYVFRKGYDVVGSRMRFGDMKLRSFEEHCVEWAHSVAKYDYLLATPESFAFRQEDLVEDPDAIFAKLYAHLELPFEPDPVRFSKTTLVHPLDEPTQADVEVRDTLKARGPVYEEWSEDMRATFKRLCASGMQRLGYDLPF